MDIIRLDDIPGMKFPAGRHTKVLIGPGSKEAERFVVGYATIYPGGKVPLHSHGNEEVYTILQGSGIMQMGEEKRVVTAISSVYIPSDVPHSLMNQSEKDLVMMFVYSPAGWVDHWTQEAENHPEDQKNSP